MVAANPDIILLNWLLALPFFGATAAAFFPRLALRVRSEREAEALRRGPWPLAALCCLMGMAVCARLVLVTSDGGRVTADYWWTRDLYHLRLQADLFASVTTCVMYAVGMLLCWHLAAVGDRERAHRSASLLLAALGAGMGIMLSADVMLLVFFLLLMVVLLWLLFTQSAEPSRGAAPGPQRRASAFAGASADTRPTDQGRPAASGWFMGVGYVGGLLVLLGALLSWQGAGETSTAQLPLLLLTGRPGTLAAIATLFVVGLLPLLPALPAHGWFVRLALTAPTMGAVGALVALAGGAALLRLLSGLLLLPTVPGLSALCVVLGLGTLWWGIVRAWLAGDLRSKAAWATVAASGYLLLAVGEAAGPGGSSRPAAAALSHLVAAPLALLAIWLSSSAVLARVGTDAVAGLSGLLREMPSAAAGLLAGGLSLCGLPGTAGFLAHRLLVSQMLRDRYWALAAAVILADIAFGLVIVDTFRRVFMRREPAPAVRPGSPTLAAPLLILTLALVVAGIWSGPLSRWSQSVAGSVLSLRP